MGHLLFSFIESLLSSLYKSLRRRIRQWQLVRYAISHGYSFSPERLADDIAFPGNVSGRSPSKEYKVGQAINIIHGTINGLRFTYFEKTLIEMREDASEEPVATRSVIFIGQPEDGYFESEIAFDKELPFYREDGGISFWWNNAGPAAKTIPANKLDQWLAEISSTFKPRTSERVLAADRV